MSTALAAALEGVRAIVFAAASASDGAARAASLETLLRAERAAGALLREKEARSDAAAAALAVDMGERAASDAAYSSSIAA